MRPFISYEVQLSCFGGDFFPYGDNTSAFAWLSQDEGQGYIYCIDERLFLRSFLHEEARGRKDRSIGQFPGKEYVPYTSKTKSVI